LYDERVLGGGGFVAKVLKETVVSEAVKRPQMPLPELVGKVSESFKVDAEDLYRGKRKREVSRARALVSYLAVHKMGYRFSEVGEVLRVHPVNVARSLDKGEEVYKCHPEACASFV
jgi:chromosomal replication initiation ATPase DnaA